ncbi:MAG: DsbA family protein [Vicinamibacterales bacterium]
MTNDQPDTGTGDVTDGTARSAGEPVLPGVAGAVRLTGAVHVDYFTDPLCCWSWALEPAWCRLQHASGGRLTRTVVLGGMIENWTSYRDPMNDVRAPAQLAPLWHMAGRATGVAIDPGIWHLDPPASSLPASIAVKAAALQGGEAGERYLALAREAVMRRRMNVARSAVLVSLAEELAGLMPRRFDADRFVEDLTGIEAREALRADLQRTRLAGIGRFPTMVAHGRHGSRVAVGYRPFDALVRFIEAASQDPAAVE